MIQKYISKFSPNEKKIFYVASLFVVLAILDRAFLGPALGKIESIEKEIQQQKVIVERDRRFLSYQDRILDESALFQDYLTDEIEEDNVIKTEFLSSIEQLATKANISLIKSNPSNIEKKKRYIKYFSQIDCSGQLENMVSFMHAINSTKDLLKVVKFNMTPKRGSSDEVNVSMTIAKMVMPKDDKAVDLVD